MRFCPNCGTQCEEGAHFCGECGFSFADTQAAPAPQPEAALQQETYHAAEQSGTWQQQSFGAPEQPVYNSGIPGEVPAEKKKNRLPLFIGIAVACVCLIGIIAFAVSGLAGGGKSADFVGSQQAFLEERMEALTAPVAKESFSSDVTISAAVNGSGEPAEMLTKILTDSAIVFKANNSSGKSVWNAVLKLRGSNVLEGLMSMTEKEIRFSVPNANDTCYVMSMDDFLERMEADAGNTSVSVNAKEMRDDMKEIVNRYIGVFGEGINKDHIETEKREVSLTEIGETVKCTIMTWTPDEDELIGLCDALADTLENDEQLANLLAPYATVSGEYADGYDMLETAADELRDGAEDFASQLVESGFSWRIALDGKNNLTWVSVADDSSEIAMERFTDSDGGASAYYAVSDGNEMFMIFNEYESSGEKRTGTLSADTPQGGISLDYDLDLSKRSVYGVPYGTYTPDLRNIIPGLKVKLSVADGAESGSTDHVVTVEGLDTLSGNMVSDVSLTVNTSAKSTAKEPEGSTTEDLSAYSDEEVMELMDELVNDIGTALLQSPEIMELIQTLGGTF